MKAGVLAINDPAKGLWRDTEALVWALQAEPVCSGPDRLESVSVFMTNRFRDFEDEPLADIRSHRPKQMLTHVVQPGTRLDWWLHKIDVMICNEVWLPRLFEYAQRRGVRVVYVPNLDWATTTGGTRPWIASVRRSGVEVWAKTESVKKILASKGIDSCLMRWSVPDPVRRDRNAHQKESVGFLMIAGRGGWKNRRGLDLALRAYAIARNEDPRITLTVHSVKPVRRYIADDLLETEGLHVTEGYIERSELARYYERADALLYPTRWDGFGLSLLEALHAGLPVIATDGNPMRDLVEHEHNGLLVPSERHGSVRLAPRYECSVAGLSQAMLRLSDDPVFLDRITCPEPGQLEARQHAFGLSVRRAVLNAPRARVLAFTKSACSQGSRRSEEYWCDALRSYGYEPEFYFYDWDKINLGRILAEQVDFILVCKVPAQFIRELRTYTDAPVVLWHHDLCDTSNTRWQWFSEAAECSDLAAIPEPAGSAFDSIGSDIVQIFPGAKVDGDRGPGRRPRRGSPDPKGDEIVFVGQLTGRRTRLLSALASRLDLTVYGGEPPPGSAMIRRDAVWGKAATDVLRRAAIVLSVSMRRDRYYTSNRLFNSAGAGACVMVESFPGLHQLYPPHCVVEFNGPADAARKAGRLLNRKDKQRRLRLSAENHTWRYHTWTDRIGELLRQMRSIPANRRFRVMDRIESTRIRRYWNDRVAALGARAAGYYRWTDRQLQETTDSHWTRLLPIIEKYRDESDATLLDFGCGAGRFSTRLTGIGLTVFGVDISERMLDIAQAQNANGHCHFIQSAPWQSLPFDDSVFDVIWSFTCLQHIPDGLWRHVVAEVRRVVSENGLIVLVENTHPHEKRRSNSGHVVFRPEDEYINAFPGIEAVDRFSVAGEEHAVLVGRLDGNG